jgi:hypothetical protein
MDDGFFGFLISAIIVFVIGAWFIETVIPLLFQGALILAPAGGASFLMGKSISSFLQNCKLSWKSTLSIWIIGIFAGIAFVISCQEAAGWRQTACSVYAIPIGLFFIWLTLWAWGKSKTVDLRWEIQQLERKTTRKTNAVDTIQQEISRIRADIEEKTRKHASALQDREQEIGIVEEIIRCSGEPRTLILSRDSFFREAARIGENDLKNDIAQLKKIPKTDCSEVHSLKLAVLRAALIDVQTHHALPAILKAQDILNGLENELNRFLPEQQILQKALQEAKDNLRTRTVILD